MRIWFLAVCAITALLQNSPAVPSSEGAVIDSMDEVRFAAPKEKGKIELAPGREGKALRFSFDHDCSGIFMTGRTPGTSAWNNAAGLSFWVKGDGSEHLGGLEFIWNGDYGTRYAYAFPISSTDWKKVVVPWRNLIPELGKTIESVDPKRGNAPSKLGPIAFGKWWYWRDYAAHSYTVDDIRLEPSIALNKSDYRPAGDPLARVRAKLKAGKPITVVTMGDSLTDGNHWTNREHNWPALLKAKIKEKVGSDAKIVNPAMGGTELRQNLVVMPRWTSTTPAQDLVTIFFGFNDWNSGMRGPGFAAAQRDAVDRIRRATNGHADVLILTSCPTLENGDMLSEMAAACRDAAKRKNAGLCDVFAAFKSVPEADRAGLYASDKVHLSLAGQELVTQEVFRTISGGATHEAVP